jgi:hypothetical protein
MSLVFSNASENKTRQGYFRIGLVTLSIPPSDISTSHTINNERIGTLRGANEMFRKTGQARFDVSVTFTAVIDDLADTTTKYHAWEDVRMLLAMFKSAPFTEVESPYLRQVLAGTDPSLGDLQVLSMAMRQLKIDSHPDIVDGLIVTLTLTYFNHKPYSVNFEYKASDGSPTNARGSKPYKDYLTGWIANNLDHCNPLKGDPVPKKWSDQNNGVVSVSYRTYTSINTGQLPSLAAQTSQTTNVVGIQIPTSVVSSAAAAAIAQKGKLAPSVANIVIAAANKYGVDPAIAQALCYVESSGNQTAHAKGSTAAGLFQITAAVQKEYGVTNVYDPVQNANAGVQYIKQQLNVFGSYELAIAAYNMGAGSVKKCNGIPPKGYLVPSSNAPQYVFSILASAMKNYGYTGSANAQVPAPVNVIRPVTTSNAPISSSSNPITNTQGNSEQLLEGIISYMCQNMGYEVDHRMEVGGVGTVFLFKTSTIKVGPYDSPEKGIQEGLYPTQLSVLFVNNLAQIPLSLYQYPTYQHVGPCSSTIQISFISRGFVVGEDDPQHPVLKQLTFMASNLEKQYHNMRGQFRSVASVHRMQAVFIENKVLSLLGIFGLMVDQITTQTIPEASDMVSVQLTGSQYENIFEEIESYKLNGISQQYMQTVSNLVLKSPTLDNLSGDEAKILSPITAYKTSMNSGDETWLSQQLLEVAKSTDNSIFNYTGQETTFSSVGGLSMWAALPPSTTPNYPVAQRRGLQLAQAGTGGWNIVDYLMFKTIYQNYRTMNPGVLSGEGVSGANGEQSTISAKNYISGTETSIAGTKVAQIKQAYIDLFPYFAANNLQLRNAINQVMNSPKYSPQIKAAVPTSNIPGAAHGSYAAMKLADPGTGQDVNPGMYFINDQDKYKKIAKDNLKTVLDSIVKSDTDANAATLNGSSQNVNVSTTTSIPGNLDSVMAMTNIPGYDMSEAFPTYKLMFLEDANEGIYYAFDNFYSYASITDIEMERPYDKPATLRIQMTNLSNLLNPKLFDGSLAGAWDHTLDKYASLEATSSDRGAVAGGGGSVGVTAEKKPFGAPNQINQAVFGSDNIEGPRGGDMNYRRVPLQYFPLQTGTKIQLRIGNTNDPDKLFPVFCGEVTELEEGEIITIVAQSYLLELTNQLGDQAKTDSWFHVGSVIINGVKSIAPFNVLGNISKGPAYGGITIWGDSADTGTIISNMLKSSSAKHFGHWQVNQQPNGLLKGFTWKELALKAVGAVSGSDAVSNLTAYDRTDENICINESTMYDGSSTDYKDAHKYADQGFWFRAFAYNVDSSTTWSSWDLIQDVSRRYPEYLLLEKWYGFPYSCNATLVYGHPFDWYWARQTLIGDQEAEKVALSNPDFYQQWWNAKGKSEVTQLFTADNIVGPPVLKNPDFYEMWGPKGKVMAGLVQTASTGYSGLCSALNTFLGYSGVNPSGGTLDSITSAIVSLLSTPIVPFGKRYADNLKNLQKSVDAIKKDLKAFVDAKTNPNGIVVSSELLKPIRRYHFIDHQSIIHNEITINDKIYNQVKIGDGLTGNSGGKIYSIAANGNLPACHIRSLDVTERINNPKQNVIDQTIEAPGTDGRYGLIMAYAQSFLREEVGKMYRGELLLRGIPEIEPMDVLLLMDIPGALLGPVEVEKVTHIFNQEMGFVTIIKPRALTVVNEAATANFVRVLMQTFGGSLAEINRLTTTEKSLFGLLGTTGAGAATAVSALTILNSPKIISGIASKITSFISPGATAATPVGRSVVGEILGTSGEVIGTTTGVVVEAAEAGTAVVAGAVEGAAAGLTLGTFGVPILVLCAIAVIGTAALSFFNASTGNNPLRIVPLIKYGRPWMGGLQGWATNDLIGVVNNEIYQFMNDEIFPLLQLWMDYHQYKAPIVNQQGLSEWVPQL